MRVKSMELWSQTAAAAAAKSLQSCPTLCDPQRWQPTRLPRPWDSPGKNTGVGYFLLQCMKVKTEKEVAQSDPLEKVSRVRHLSLFERAPAAYVSGANFLS